MPLIFDPANTGLISVDAVSALYELAQIIEDKENQIGTGLPTNRMSISFGNTEDQNLDFTYTIPTTTLIDDDGMVSYQSIDYLSQSQAGLGVMVNDGTGTLKSTNYIAAFNELAELIIAQELASNPVIENMTITFTRRTAILTFLWQNVAYERTRVNGNSVLNAIDYLA